MMPMFFDVTPKPLKRLLPTTESFSEDGNGNALTAAAGVKGTERGQEIVSADHSASMFMLQLLIADRQATKQVC